MTLPAIREINSHSHVYTHSLVVKHKLIHLARSPYTRTVVPRIVQLPISKPHVGKTSSTLQLLLSYIHQINTKTIVPTPILYM